ncbi:hypothetical protein DXG03_005566 [Asterophora parasitica]|uniref:Uncharacterized protein n=1 Tax=Asterophora parasitica TaxID=117018 RepID=A0A9P7FZS5_9AGAR|nr:hypothetical protein DXG03_005566 [Asterophora parasitica]
MPPPPPKHSTPAARHNTIATPESANTVPLPIPPPSRSSQRASSLRSEPPQQIQPSPFPPGAHQPSSPDTLRSDASITTGVSNLDIVTFPTPTRRGWPSTLSDIPEVPSVRSHSRSSMNEEPSPSPSRALADQWRRSIGGSNLTSPATPVRDMLSPTFQARGRTNERANGDQARRASSGSTIHIHVEPPSRPPSSAGIRDPEQRGFLSPNSRPLALVPEEPTGPPVIPDMGSLSPQGFVPSSMTLSESSDQRSRGHGRQGSRTGSNIYANATPPVQSSTNMFAHGGSRQQPSARNSIYGNAPPPQGPYNSSSIASLTPREVPRQLYAAPSPSAAGPQPLPTGSPSGPGFQPLPTNLSRPRQIYAPSPSVTGNQPLPTDLSGTRQIYASSPSVIGSQPLPVDLSRPQIYAPSPSVTGSQPLPSRQRQIYAPSPSVSGTQPLPADALPTAVGQRGAAASRTSIYGPPIASSAGSQTPAQGARQFYGLPVNISAGSQTPAQGTRQLYSLPASSSAGSHTPAQGARPLYAPAPSLQGTHTNGPPSIYGPPPASGDATSRNGPVIPPPSTYPIFVPPAPSPSLPTMPLGPSSRTGPVIPGVTVYSPSQPPPQEPVIPFIPPIPGSMTPSGSNIQLNVTPRARFAEIAEDPNEDSPIVHDEETMRNTHINKLGGSPLRVPLQPPLPVPPPSVPVPTPGPSMPIPTPAPATRKNKKGRR